MAEHDNYKWALNNDSSDRMWANLQVLAAELNIQFPEDYNGEGIEVVSSGPLEGSLSLTAEATQALTPLFRAIEESQSKG